MKYWLFNQEMLAKALAAYEAQRQQFGATEQQAKDETLAIASFLGSAAAVEAKLINDDGRGG